MSVNNATGRPGGFARQRFIDRRSAWRRKVWWVFPLLIFLPFGIALPIAFLTGAAHREFWIGFGIGAGGAMALVLFDSPPAHVEKWRTGADGEKSTARTLRPLLSRGWALFNDIDTGHGNIDHMLVGPAGVFLLESKRLAGQVRIEGGKLVVRWHEDPNDGYDNTQIARRARGAAVGLHSHIDWPEPHFWVQAVVVLWADFEQRSIESKRVAWIRGDEIATVLANRPSKYSGEALRELTSRTREAVMRFREENQSAGEAQSAASEE